MTTYKKASSDFIISTKANSSANITLATNTVFIDGNLIVGGNSTNVYRTELTITDNLITVNKGETGNGVTLGEAGVEVDRGLEPNVKLRWNEATDYWQISNGGPLFGNILFSTASNSLAVVEDLHPQLGGNLDVYTRTFYSSVTQAVTVDSNLAVKHTTVAPTVTGGYTIIYANTAGSGGSGLYVTSTLAPQRELTTLTRAIVYSLVL